MLKMIKGKREFQSRTVTVMVTRKQYILLHNESERKRCTMTNIVRQLIELHQSGLEEVQELDKLLNLSRMKMRKLVKFARCNGTTAAGIVKHLVTVFLQDADEEIGEPEPEDEYEEEEE